MTAPVNHVDFAAADRAPAVPAMAYAKPNRAEPVFGLHPALHVAMFAGFFAYLGLMWAAFADAELALPFVIFALFLGASFAVPALWARVAPNDGPKARFRDFLAERVDTGSWPLTGKAAAVQVMIMPAMLVGWGMFIATLSATV